MDVQFIRQKILDLIDDSIHILLIAHQKPDGDTLGSVLSLSHFLDTRSKRHKIFCKDLPSSYLNFLPGVYRVQDDIKIFFEKRFDLVIICDSSDLQYAGVLEFFSQLSYPVPTIVNIDHHQTNCYFGDINLVDSNASSTTQILHRFFDELSIPMNRDMATCLLTGIMTDTGGFSNPATTFESVGCASSLLSNGAKLNKITHHTVKNKSVETLKLWGNVLARIQTNFDLGIATAIIKNAYFEQAGADNKAAEGLANFLNNLSGVKAVLVLHEVEENKIKGSFRTTEPHIDVAQLASFLGGGGHQKAAGFTIHGRLLETHYGWEVI